MSKKLVAIVTGGSGFIGGSFVSQLDKDETISKILILDLSFPDYQLTEKMYFRPVDVRDPMTLLNETKKFLSDGDYLVEWYDNVGLLGTDDTNELGSYPATALSTNVNGFLNQVQVAKEINVHRFFHQTKNMFSHDFENWYTTTKRQAEYIAFWGRESYGVNITVAVYTNASGHRQHLGPVRKMFPLFTVLSLLDLDLTVYGKGTQLMDIIHVDDLVKAAILLTRADNGDDKVGRIYDIGTGQGISVVDFSNKLIEKSKSESSINFYPMRKGEPETSKVFASTEDVKFLEEKYGFKPSYSLDEIITEYIDYWIECTDYTYIRNTLIYFQTQYNTVFTKNGSKINIFDISEDFIKNKFEEKRLNYK